ncbi:MAG: protein translocase subunit SecD [Candidatus Moranbacteria bacterium]|nr:protein translocase subunit SecD [Candidatus Moranbacteria bacterium]
MNKKIRQKFILVVLFAILVGGIAVPKIPYLPAKAQESLDKFQINLGLDLQGGLHLEYEMDLSQVPDDKKGEAIDSVQAVVERRVNAYGVGEPVVQHAKRGDQNFLIVEFPGAEDVADVKNVIDKTPFLQFREEKTEEELEEEKKIYVSVNEQFVKKNAQAVLDRINNGENFDDIYNEENTKIGLNISDEDLQFFEKGQLSSSIDDVIFSDDLNNGSVYNGILETDESYLLVKKLETQGEGEEKKIKAKILYSLDFFKKVPEKYKATDLDGKHLERADVSFSGGGVGLGTPSVSLEFNDEGTKLFAEITKRNLEKTVAIFLDNEVISAPVVNDEITTGQAVISGNFTVEEAKNLVKRMNEGALPVPIKLVSQQSIGASLGMESLAMGLKAGLIGLILTMIYMIFYYRVFGVVAAVALMIYATTIVSIFKISGTMPQGMAITLTLAGIAGLILSVGMAVDANILIFERIKEELKKGKSLKYSVNEGFERAWSSIRDGNYSTIITSFILMMIGAGFVKGFALILIIGVLISMFTAIVLVKIIVKFISRDWLENNTWLIFGFKKKVEIENAKEKKFLQIINKRKFTYIFSAGLIGISIFALSNFGLKLGIDFVGGTLTEFKISDGIGMPDTEKVCQIIGEDGCNESFTLQESDNNHIIIRYKQASEEFNQRVLTAVREIDPQAEQLRTDFIGATISEQLKSGAFKAIILSVIAILIYIAIAFRKVSFPVSSWNYGIGAVLALTHDIIIVLGVFAFLGYFYNIEIGIPFVAALLTILGYSVNDTIVVYDRIRENVIRTRETGKFEKLLNRSLNESLARSMNTSLTVVVVLVSVILFGGESLQSFAIAMLVGVIAGTYSSMFVATAFIASIFRYKKDKK